MDSRSIAELWDRFDKLGNYIETERLLNSWGTKGSDGLSHDGRNHSADDAEIAAIRAQLIERCKEVHDSDGAAVEFSIYIERIENGKTLIRAFTDEHSLFLTKESAMNMSAAYAFMAWELEQRAKEVGNG